MDVDITKPDTGFRSVARPRSSGAPTPDTLDAEHATYAEPLSEGEGDEEMDIAPARDEGARIGLANGQAADAIAFREKHLKERAQQPGPSRALSSECLPVLSPPPTTPAPRPPPRLRTLSIDPLVPSSTFDERFKDRLRAVKHANDEVEVHTAEASPTRTFAELAALFYIPRDDRNDAAELHSAKGHTRASLRGTVHVRRVALNCLLSWHFRVPRAATAQTPRRGRIL